MRIWGSCPGRKLTNSFSHSSKLNIDVSSTLTILRLLEGVLSICSAIILLKSFENLQWTFSSRANGVSSLCLLGLSPTSDSLGTLGLVFSRHARWTDRLAATGRISLLTAIWVSGVVLFARTQLVVVYESVMSYNVAAGVGQFNGSYVAEYLKQFQDIDSGYNYVVLPYSTLVTASNLIVNTMHSTAIDPVTCEDTRVCQSYLLSGGLIMTTPWPPINFTSYPVITIHNVPSIQIDFARGVYNDTFIDTRDCAVFGKAGFTIGMKFCLARSNSTVGSLISGMLDKFSTVYIAKVFRHLRVYERRTGQPVLDSP